MRTISRTYTPMGTSDGLQTLCEKLLGPEPGKRMTEADGDGVESVCMVVCALACLDGCAPLFAGTEAARQQLAEVGARGRVRAGPALGCARVVSLGAVRVHLPR